MFVDVWDHFNRDRSLYGKDGLHLSSVGKARLGRVLDEGVRKELERNKIQTQVEIISPGQAGSGHVPEPVVGRSDEVVGRERDVRHAGVQVGEGEAGIRPMAAVRSLGAKHVPGVPTSLNV